VRHLLRRMFQVLSGPILPPNKEEGIMRRIMACAAVVAVGLYLGRPGLAVAKDAQVGVAD
jgi:hypothetical protein